MQGRFKEEVQTHKILTGGEFSKPFTDRPPTYLAGGREPPRKRNREHYSYSQRTTFFFSFLFLRIDLISFFLFF